MDIEIFKISVHIMWDSWGLTKCDSHINVNHVVH